MQERRTLSSNVVMGACFPGRIMKRSHGGAKEGDQGGDVTKGTEEGCFPALGFSFLSICDAVVLRVSKRRVFCFFLSLSTGEVC